MARGDDSDDSTPPVKRGAAQAALASARGRRVVRKSLKEEDDDEEAEENGEMEENEELDTKARASSSRKRSKRSAAADDDDDFINDEDDGEAQSRSKAKAKASKPAAKSAKQPQRKEEDEEEEEDDVEDSASRRKGKSKESASASRLNGRNLAGATTTATTTTTGNPSNIPNFLVAGKFELIPLKKDTADSLYGEPKRPVKYEIPEKSLSILEDIPQDKLRAAVSATVRMVLGVETNGKKITGTDIKKQCLEAFPEAEIKHVMPYVRLEASRRFLSVFGFDLHAGDEADKVKLSDRWYLTNAVKSETVSRIAHEGADEDADRSRAQTMTVLGLLMISDGGMEEDALIAELETLDLTKKQTSDLVKTLKEEGFIVRQSSKNAAGQTIVKYSIGQKTDLEIGRRAVLQFLMSAVGIRVEVEDEVKLINLAEDEDEEEE